MVFKKQYYCFIAGLPDISFEMTKLPFSVEEFRQMLDDVLSPSDKALIDKYFLDIDNKNLVHYLKDNSTKLNEKGKWNSEDLKLMVTEIKENQKLKNKQVPPYFEPYIKEWLNDEQEDQSKQWEDLMSSFYMEYGASIKNTLVAKWFELNLNMGNIFSAIFARKYDMPLKDIIVGENEVAKAIRNNPNARDFGLDMEIGYFEQLLRLSEDTDIFDRERKTDKFRWDWLEENIVFDYFNIEYIFAYLCKLQIVERWVNLNAEEGERVFRELISKLKNDVEVSDEQ